jgi:alkyldihydroxyacetonephosphate synthase
MRTGHSTWQRLDQQHLVAMSEQLGSPIEPLPVEVASPIARIALDQLGWAQAPQGHVVHSMSHAKANEFIASLASDIPSTSAPAVDVQRDWWPIALTWATRGQVVGDCVGVVAPTTIAQLQSVVGSANAQGIALVPGAGRSGVNGGATCPYPHVALDLKSLNVGPVVDLTSNVAAVSAGTTGPAYESWLNANGRTGGHFPQSMALSSVGGWIACRGAGQLSNRYGKIEDLVESLTVVLADGTVLETGHHAPRSAVGGDLTQLFVGSEGSLGVIAGARVRVFETPTSRWFRAVSIPTYESGLDIARTLAQTNALPAVFRIYDEIEAERNFSLKGPVVIAIDEGSNASTSYCAQVLLDSLDSVEGGFLDEGIAHRWWQHRNDVSALVPYVNAGALVDTIEISVSWTEAARVYAEICTEVRAQPGVVAVSAHVSHCYDSGVGMYFTFGGFPMSATGQRSIQADREWYMKIVGHVCATAAKHGGAISHHHGIGRVRAGDFVRNDEQRHAALQTLKSALDPSGILNPGVLGLW